MEKHSDIGEHVCRVGTAKDEGESGERSIGKFMELE